MKQNLCYKIEYIAFSQKHVSFDFKNHDFILPK